MLENSPPENRMRDFVKRSLLETRLALYYAAEDIKALLRCKWRALEALVDAMELRRVGPSSLKGRVSSLLGVLYDGVPVKPLSRQTLKEALRYGLRCARQGQKGVKAEEIVWQLAPYIGGVQAPQETLDNG